MKDQNEYEIAQCELNPDMKGYKRFDEIPENRINESSLVAWIVNGGELHETPQDVRTERVLWAAVRHDDSAYAFIDASEVSDHRALTIEALNRGGTHFLWAPDEYKDEDFLIEMTEKNIDALASIGLDRKYSHLLTDKVAEAICSRSLAQAYGFRVAASDKIGSLIKDSYLEKAILTSDSDFALLTRMKKVGVLVKLLSDGFWPNQVLEKNTPVSTFKAGPPSIPSDAMDLRFNSKTLGEQVLYGAWLKSRPVAEVVESLHGSEKGMEELLSLYGDGVLRTYMKDYRSIRGRLLEHDLGM